MSTFRSSSGGQSWLTAMRGMRIGALLSLLTLLLGFSLGAIFGLFEEALKEGFEETAVQTLASEADPQAAAAALAGRSWSYLKRSHLHANGLGTSALAMILLSAGHDEWCRIEAPDSLPAGNRCAGLFHLLDAGGLSGTSSRWHRRGEGVANLAGHAFRGVLTGGSGAGFDDDGEGPFSRVGLTPQPLVTPPG
ncbi:MAG: hypothetical protein WBO71_13230, partial [Thermoanaerobaculia bacterium]